MKPFFILIILNLVFIELTFAEDCKIAGISNPPQTISCKYRDEWFRKREGRIYCKDGEYRFGRFDLNGVNLDENLITSATHADTAKGSSVLMFYVDDFGQTLTLQHVFGKRWKGNFDWYFSRMHCKLPRNGIR